MTPLERRIALMRSGVRPVDIARDAKVNPTTVYRVLDNLSTSDRIQRKIAKAMEQPVEHVFPKRYPLPGKVTGRPEQHVERAAS